jgi:hypothetical protein
MLPVVTGMLPVVTGMLPVVTGMLPVVTGMLPVVTGMLLALVSAIPKNWASAAFTPAENIVPFLDIKPFSWQKAISACSTSGAR